MSITKKRAARPSKYFKEFSANFKKNIEGAVNHEKEFETMFSGFGDKKLPKDTRYYEIEKEFEAQEKKQQFKVNL